MCILGTTSCGREGLNEYSISQNAFVYVEIEIVKLGRQEAQSTVWSGSHNQGSGTGPQENL